jgi:hypothetical protein
MAPTARPLLSLAREMTNDPFDHEHGWTSPHPGERFRTRLPAKRRERLEGDSSASALRIPLRSPPLLSAQAMLASLLSICLLGASGLLWMHSQVRGPSSASPVLAVAEPPAAVPVATITATASIPAPTVATAPIATAASVASVASVRSAVAVPLHRSRPKSTPHVRLYPFPVPTPPEVIVTPSAPAGQSLATEPNPYDVSSERPSDHQE